MSLQAAFPSALVSSFLQALWFVTQENSNTGRLPLEQFFAVVAAPLVSGGVEPNAEGTNFSKGPIHHASQVARF